MNRQLISILSVMMFVFSISCVNRKISYDGKTVVNGDGSIVKSGKLTIAPLDTSSGTQDSTEAAQFYSDHLVPAGFELFETHREFSDGVLYVDWMAAFDKSEMPITDYSYHSDKGPTAKNSVTVEVKNRWFFKDYQYKETFVDPVEAEKYYPMIDSALAKASGNILDSKSLKGLRDRQGAEAILADLQKKTGSDLIALFMENPQMLDSLTEKYDAYFVAAGDSLSGLAGVKLSPDSAASLLKNSFDAVWDTVLTDHPGIFGAYGLAENEHYFRVEVEMPGCIKSANADTVDDKRAVWNFRNADFFGQEKTMMASARDWLWGNVVISIVVILVILFLILRPLRRRGTV